MTLHVRAKMLCYVWSYNLYDMTLSTEQQRRHMIKNNIPLSQHLSSKGETIRSRNTFFSDSIYRGCPLLLQINLAAFNLIIHRFTVCKATSLL